jgi:hypothetical protein
VIAISFGGGRLLVVVGVFLLFFRVMGSGSGSWGELGEQKFLRDLMKFL